MDLEAGTGTNERPAWFQGKFGFIQRYNAFALRKLKEV